MPWNELRALLGGSWVVISGVISRVPLKGSIGFRV